ncbi:MAG: dehydrogenase [ubiquinone] 1 alpha subcomplex assembly factor 7 [Alphaproteobacteria bacterium]|jgi:SAM-dependent MidA family methyltransferase|nr:dehydrogenase [ubiquinone] 1 alpha subcomplex assembly factor 7 [Alphaproteobacteria bacterium]
MASDMHPLEAEIRRRIAVAGPMPVGQFMSLCLTHPVHGYYMTRDPLGAAGDFITAPEISQMFGELIGLWAASVWRQMGSPENVRLIELGPGRCTMMLDALRAAHAVPEFRKAVVVHLVEVSPALEQRQRRALSGVEMHVDWHKALEDVPAGPAIIVANEFFDALPVQQAVMCADGWHERVVKIDEAGNFQFSNARDPIPLFDQMLPAGVRDAQIGEIFEWRADQVALELGRRVARSDGAALVIDYGHLRSATGDTLQAVGAHEFADPLMAPGQVDLTAHVDFQALAEAAESMGARAYGPIAQGDLLDMLGIANRASALKRASPPEKAAAIDSALARLTDAEGTGMGGLFKAIGFGHPKLGTLPGF